MTKSGQVQTGTGARSPKFNVDLGPREAERLRDMWPRHGATYDDVRVMADVVGVEVAIVRQWGVDNGMTRSDLVGVSERAWSRETVARLRTLWAQSESGGQYVSAAAIGLMLGKSKSAIVGKAHRLKLPARPSPIKGKGAWTPSEVARLCAFMLEVAAGRITWQGVALDLDRPVDVCRNKASRLALRQFRQMPVAEDRFYPVVDRSRVPPGVELPAGAPPPDVAPAPFAPPPAPTVPRVAEAEPSGSPPAQTEGVDFEPLFTAPDVGGGVGGGAAVLPIARRSALRSLPLESACRWPIGDPKAEGFRFCTAERVRGMSYCVEHQCRSVGRGGLWLRAALAAAE